MAKFSLLALCLFPFLAWCEAPDVSWEKLDESDGISVFRKEVEGSPIVAFRGEGIIDAPLSRVADVLTDVTHEKEWVDHLERAYIVRQISPDERIEYSY